MAEEFIYRVPIEGGSIKLTSPKELNSDEQQNEAQKIVREHLAKQTQSESGGWGASLDQGLQWLHNKVDEGARKVDTMVGMPDPGQGVLASVNPVPNSAQGAAGLATSILGTRIPGGGLVPNLLRMGAVPASEALVGSATPQGIDSTQLGIDSAMNALPGLAAGVRSGYRQMRPAHTLQADDVARNVGAINEGLEMPGYIRQGATPQDSMANVSDRLTPARGGARTAVYDRANDATRDVTLSAGDPYIRVPLLSDRDMRLSEALQGLRQAAMQQEQGAAAGGIQASIGNKNAVVDTAQIREQIYAGLRERNYQGTANSLNEIRGQERRGLGTTEVYTGMTSQGQQNKPLAPDRTLDMGELQTSLRKAVNDGRFTADEAERIFRSAIMRDARGLDTTDAPGKFNLFGARINQSGKMGMSINNSIELPRTIGSPDRRGALNVPSNGAYNPLSVLLGQIGQRLTGQ